ncbi:MAG TPA: hypothetical protein VE631_02290, partial [Alphaproteobacteria bacterium]|nr:hypothetical protein [Alphaproteobacteria bacterium]
MAQGSIQSGIALMLASIGLISVVDTVCKVYTAELPAMQIVWGYFMGILLSLSGYFAWRRIPL